MGRARYGRGMEIGGLLRAAAPWVLLGLAGGAIAFGMRNPAVRRAATSPLGRDLGKRLLAWAGVASLPEALARLTSVVAGEAGRARAAAERGEAPGGRDQERASTLDPATIERAPVVESQSRAGVNVPTK